VRMRAFASAFMLFSLTLVGIGGGPWLAGLLSEHFAAAGEAQPLCRALELMLLFNLASVVCLLQTARGYRQDLARAAGETA